jgi:hypothetical protein
LYNSRPEPETAYDLYVRGRALLQRGDAHATAVAGREEASYRDVLDRLTA